MAWPAAHLALLWPKSAELLGQVGAKQMVLATDPEPPGSKPRVEKVIICPIFPEDCSMAPLLGRTDLIVEVPQAKIHNLSAGIFSLSLALPLSSVH